MMILQYMTAARHTSTLHRLEGNRIAPCMPRVIITSHRSYVLELKDAQEAHEQGAKVCRKCFPEGLPLRVDFDVETGGKLGPIDLFAAKPDGGRTALDYHGAVTLADVAPDPDDLGLVVGLSNHDAGFLTAIRDKCGLMTALKVRDTMNAAKSYQKRYTELVAALDSMARTRR